MVLWTTGPVKKVNLVVSYEYFIVIKAFLKKKKKKLMKNITDQLQHINWAQQPTADDNSR